MGQGKKWMICIGILALVSYAPFNKKESKAHAIFFCGEYVPVDNDFVANKLMNVIKSQVNVVNMPSIRTSAATYFKYISSYLNQNGIPEDFKYLPIVESAFQLVQSRAGARGFWQLMPETAKDLGLRVDEIVDERDDIEKSTKAACRLLKDYYQFMHRRHKKASWVLTAAAYNFGIGNMSKAVASQGDNYFMMNLNAETALYVYKIIAIKELFEFPEVYMKNFGYNILTTIKQKNTTDVVNIFDSSAAVSLANFVNSEKPSEVIKTPVVKSFIANISGKYKKFKDGNLVHIRLQEDLEFPGFFLKKGNEFIGNGWILEDRVYVELPYGHSLQLFDQDFKKGVSLSALNDEEPVILKLTLSDGAY